MILLPLEMQEVKGEDKFGESIRGWVKPGMPVSDLLTAYSQLGGTHHSALVYGDVIDELVGLAELMGWDAAVIG